MFRGREVTHPERGEMILNRLADELGDLAVIEQRPTQDGRNAGGDRYFTDGMIDVGVLEAAKAAAP